MCACAALCMDSARAEWATPTASEMAQSCNLARDTPANTQKKFALCSMLIKGFTDGYRRGANKGMRTAFTADQANLATTQGIDDLVRRITAIRPRAECIPQAATTEQIEIVFVNYVKEHPSFSHIEYPSVLSGAIEEYFCPG